MGKDKLTCQGEKNSRLWICENAKQCYVTKSVSGIWSVKLMRLKLKPKSTARASILINTSCVLMKNLGFILGDVLTSEEWDLNQLGIQQHQKDIRKEITIQRGNNKPQELLTLPTRWRQWARTAWLLDFSCSGSFSIKWWNSEKNWNDFKTNKQINNFRKTEVHLFHKNRRMNKITTTVYWILRNQGHV